MSSINGKSHGIYAIRPLSTGELEAAGAWVARLAANPEEAHEVLAMLGLGDNE